MSIADVIYANQIRITPCSDKQEDHAKPVERRVSGSHATHEQPRHAARACHVVLSRLRAGERHAAAAHLLEKDTTEEAGGARDAFSVGQHLPGAPSGPRGRVRVRQPSRPLTHEEKKLSCSWVHEKNKSFVASYSRSSRCEGRGLFVRWPVCCVAERESAAEGSQTAWRCC